MSTTHDSAREAAADIGDAAKAQASKLRDKGRDAAQRRADQARSFASQQAGAVAAALDEAASAAAGGAAQAVLSRAASGVRDVAQAIDDRAFSDAGAELAGFARDRPGLFLGGAMLAGFAAARFASARPSAPADDDGAGHTAPPPPVGAPDAPHLRAAPQADAQGPDAASGASMVGGITDTGAAR